MVLTIVAKGTAPKIVSFGLLMTTFWIVNGEVLDPKW